MSHLISGARKVWRRRAVVGVLVLASLLATAPVAAGADAQTTPSGPVITLGHNGRVVFVVVVVGLFAALWFALLWQDRIRTNKRLDQLLTALIAHSAECDTDQRLTGDEIRAQSSAASTRGAPGLTRTTIALGLLTLVGVALAALLVGNGTNASDLLKTVVTALTTALTTVIGFYFGAKATSDAVAQGGAPAGGAGGPTKPGRPPGPPTITRVTPGSRQVTVEFSAPEKTGGSPITGYTVTSDPGGKTVTGPQSPIVVTELEPGTQYTFTVHATNASGHGPESGTSGKQTPGA